MAHHQPSDFFRAVSQSDESSSELLPSYSLEADTAATVEALIADGPSSSTLPVAPAAHTMSSWPDEKTTLRRHREASAARPRRDLSEYRNSVVLVDEASGELVGVVGELGAIALDEVHDEPAGEEAARNQGGQEQAGESLIESPPLPVDGSKSGASSFPGLVASDVEPATTVNDVESALSAVDLNEPAAAPSSGSPPVDASPSLQTPQDIISRGTFRRSSPPRPVSHFPGLRSSPSDMSLRTIPSSAELPPEMTTIRRAHSRRTRASGTVTSIGGSSFYTAPGGTWRGTLVGTRILDGEGSVRGTLSGGGVVKRTAAPGEGASNGGEVLLRFFDESESTFLRNHQASNPLLPDITDAAEQAHEGEASIRLLALDEPATEPHHFLWSYFSFPAQPFQGAQTVYAFSAHITSSFWTYLSPFSADQEDDATATSGRPATSQHPQARPSSYYPSYEDLPPIDPDSLENTPRPIYKPKRGRLPTDYRDSAAPNGDGMGSSGDPYAEYGSPKLGLWHIDAWGLPRRAWMAATSSAGVGML